MLKQIEIESHTFAVVDQGTGTPILFVHGFPLDHTMWQAQIDHFAERHRYRVIAPDLRGFGKSFSPDQPLPQLISMKGFADDLAELLDVLDVTEPIIYCGLSMGGYIGWQFIRHYSERVESLIMCDTKAEADPPEVARGRHFMADGVVDAGTTLATRGMLERLVSPNTLATSPSIAERLQLKIDNTHPTAVAAAQRGMAERPDSSSLLPLISVPTLFICGEDDQITTPEEMQQMASNMPNARLRIIPRAGHMPPMEQPDATNQAIAEFIAADPIA